LHYFITDYYTNICGQIRAILNLGIMLALWGIRREETKTEWTYSNDGLLQTAEKLLQMGLRFNRFPLGSDGDLVGSRRRDLVAIDFGTQVRENLLIQ